VNQSAKEADRRATRVLRLIFALVLSAVCGARAEPAGRATSVSIARERFLLNGAPTYAGREWQGKRVEGLLFNVRAVQATFDDLNPATAPRWAYPDTRKWDPDRNTDEFIRALVQWHAHGLLAVTINLQGGSPEGYSKSQPWENNAFAPDGSLRPPYLKRLERVLDADEAAVLRGVDEATRWVLAHGYRHVLIEIDNEADSSGYNHPVLQAGRVHELIQRVKTTSVDGRHLLASTSFGGGVRATDEVIAAADFALVHGNGRNDPAGLRKLIREIRARPTWHVMPVVVNEDDHFDFEQPENHLQAALGEYASWGFFDPGKPNYQDGYQCPPVNWSINTERKKEFFALVKTIAGQ
jgi:hypothetical protein